MISVTATERWHEQQAGASYGLLEISGVRAATALERTELAALEAKKRAVESELRARYAGFSRQDFLSLPLIAAYEDYYKRFGKTYHVQLQLESVVLKGKNFPDVLPLVDANFVAELETLVLTAGHDVAKLEGSLAIDVSQDGDSMTQMNGQLRPLRAGDMVMRDQQGVSCSIIYGQDNRSPITAETGHVLYVAYAPRGVPLAAVQAQLAGIAANIKLFEHRSVIEQLICVSARS